MNIITRLLSKDNASFKEHMDTFSVGTTWHDLIKGITWITNTVTIKTTATRKDRDKAGRMVSAVLSWANDKSINNRLVIKYVVILDKDNKVILKVRNPMNKNYFKK